MPYKMTSKAATAMIAAKKKALWVAIWPDQAKEGQRERKDREMELYLKEAAAFKRKHPWCRLCSVLRPNDAPLKTRDIHHTAGRVGKLLRDQRYWMPSCRGCHNWVGKNIEAARKLGLIANVGEWNQPKL